MTRRYRQLARLPAFAHCTRRELRRVARWGDFVEVMPGHVLARRDHSDWWFFVVVSGRVVVTDGTGGQVELGPGTHFGDDAIIGLRPQTGDVAVAEPTVLFTLGPRYVLSLLPVSAAFRGVLLPGVSGADYPALFRRMHAQGQADWQRLARRRRAVAPAAAGRSSGGTGLLDLAPPRTPDRDRPPGRPISLAEAVHALAAVPPSPSAPPPPSLWSRRRRRAVLGGVVAVVTLTLSSVLFGYHPPRYVVVAGTPIDVTHDISVSGAPTYPPAGRYLLLRVQARQPTLAGYLVARLRGRPTVAVGHGDIAAEVQQGRADYLGSQQTAIRLALAAAGADPRRVTVHIVDRDLVGPSAGLVYALALDDLLTPGDASSGRVIAATGQLETNGHVEPIGWLTLKARSADADGAALLLVPSGEAGSLQPSAARVCAVPTLHEALRIVARSASARC